MKSCKDCLHNKVCINFSSYNDDLKMVCPEFKDRSRFVELPCKIGDMVYLKLNGIAEILKGDVRKMSFSRKNELVICIGRRQGRYYTTGNFKLSSFGKSVFLTLEEAKQVLSYS